MKNICKVKICTRIIYCKKLKICKAHHVRFHANGGEIYAHIPIRKRRTIEEMTRRVIQEAPKKGSIPLSVISKAVKSVGEKK